MTHHAESQPLLRLIQRARTSAAQHWRDWRDQRLDDQERNDDLARFLAHNPDTITFVFEDGAAPHRTRSYAIVSTPSLHAYLGWERSGQRDGSFLFVRQTWLADWQVSGQMEPMRLGDLALRLGR
jgi:hypothetical protein